MLRLTKDSQIDIIKYMGHLEKLGYLYYDRAMLDVEYRRAVQQISTLQYLVTQHIKECSGGVIHDSSLHSVRQFLIQARGVPESILTDRKTGNPSVAAKRREKAFSKGFAREFIRLYDEYSSTKSINGFTKSALMACRTSEEVDYEGKPLSKVSHNINENGTLRTYYRDYNHQQLSKPVRKAIKVPDKYVMVCGDFEQSDLKIVYNMMLRDRSNLDVMYRTKDSYKGIAALVEGHSFDEERFREERPLYKENTLAPIYGGESSASSEGNRVVQNVSQYLTTLPVYNTFKKRLEKRIESRLPVTVRTYFGNQVTIDSSNKSPKEVLNAALNSPAQTGTSEIVIACGNAIMDRFAQHGITSENGGIYLYLNIHDELVFMIHEDYLPYTWIFQENEDILVDDWMPLKIAFGYSRAYMTEDEELDALCKSYYKPQESIDINSLIEKGKTAEFFIPCDNTIRLAIGHATKGDQTVIAFYNVDSGTMSFNLVGSSSKNVILDSVVKIITQNRSMYYQNDITACIAYTDLLMDDAIVSSGIPISFKVSFSDSFFRNATQAATDKLDELIEKGEI